MSIALMTPGSGSSSKLIIPQYHLLGGGGGDASSYWATGYIQFNELSYSTLTISTVNMYNYNSGCSFTITDVTNSKSLYSVSCGSATGNGKSWTNISLDISEVRSLKIYGSSGTGDRWVRIDIYNIAFS